jgi:hypothetical protein
MAERTVGTITVNSRTIDLAGEILVIPQIVRLRKLEYEVRRGLSGARIAILIVGIFLFFSSSFLGITSSNPGQGFLPILGLLIVLGVLLYSFYWRRRYILAIELASGSLSSLYSKNSHGLNWLKEQIQQIIEHPPMQPTAIHVGDVWTVDARGSRGGQFGSGNKQFNN